MDKINLIRFQKKIELDLLTGCWIWKACVLQSGYGQFHMNKKRVLAHRISYEHWNGKIPRGLQIDHLCRNRSCVNPQHLEIVTPKENTQRGINFQKTKTHCPQGHEYFGTNLRVTSQGRKCRECGNTLRRQHRIEVKNLK